MAVMLACWEEKNVHNGDSSCSTLGLYPMVLNLLSFSRFSRFAQKGAEVRFGFILG